MLERKRQTCATLLVHDNVSLVDEGLDDDLYEAREFFMRLPLWHLVVHQLVLLIYKFLKHAVPLKQESQVQLGLAISDGELRAKIGLDLDEEAQGL